MFLFYILSFLKKGDTIQGGNIILGNTVYGISQESVYPLAGAAEEPRVQEYIWSGKEIKHAPLKELVNNRCTPRFSDLPPVSRKVETRQ